MTNEEEITNLKGEVDELKRLLKEVKDLAFIIPEKEKIESIVNTSGEITDLYIGKEFLPIAGGAKDHGGLSGLSDDDHTQYHNNTRGDARYLYKENTTAFTPNADYEPATKKYVDDNTPSYAPFTFVAGDNLLQAGSSTQVDKNSTTPIKFLEFDAQCNGELRIKWQGAIIETVTGYMQVYRNGNAVGTRKTLNSGGNATYMTDDVSGWTTGDKIQIYGWREDTDDQDITMAAYSGDFAEGKIIAIYGDWNYTTY
jgi:hypothetical protein